MRKFAFLAVIMVGLFWLSAQLASAAQEVYVPGIKIALEVRTPQGDLRSFQAPGEHPSYWAQDMPVVKGDKVTINAMITTGGQELGELKMRLDHKVLVGKPEEPWRAAIDTADLGPGYHLIEVWAATKSPKAKENSATLTFLIVPENDPMLAVLKCDTEKAGPPVSDEERLSSTIRSRDEKVDKDLGTSAKAGIAKPILFFVSAGPAGKEFYYTITRDGRVTYTSPRLPLPTHVLIEPDAGEGQGQAAGEIILTVRAGDAEGRFGPPAWVTLRIESGKVSK
jgi:hypothetical protein